MKGFRLGNKTAHPSRDSKGCFASGGRVSNDLAESHPITKGGPGPAPKKAAGGPVMGGKAKHRPDKGGKSKTNINIVVGHPGGAPMPGGPMGGPPPMPPMGAPPMMAKPPMPPMPPPGAMPGGPPMMGRKDGGRVGRPMPAGQDDPTEKEAESKSVGRKNGGRVGDAPGEEEKVGGGADHKFPPMTASATNGVGGLEKIKFYGKKAGKPVKEIK